MAGWAGWGAGPSGAGATGGPSRVFLAVALVSCAVIAAVFLTQRRIGPGLVAVAAVIYFGLRLFAGLGRAR